MRQGLSTREDYSTQDPLSKDPTLSVQGIFTTGGSGQGTQRSTNTHIEIQNYTSVALEKNFMRLGGRLRTTGESLTSTQGQNGTFFYSYLLDPCNDPNQTTKPTACNGLIQCYLLGESYLFLSVRYAWAILRYDNQ